MTTLIAIGLIAIFFLLMSVRVLFKKEGEFKGTCASQNPHLVKLGITCSGVCNHDGSCQREEVIDPKVLKVLDKFH